MDIYYYLNKNENDILKSLYNCIKSGDYKCYDNLTYDLMNKKENMWIHLYASS